MEISVRFIYTGLVKGEYRSSPKPALCFRNAKVAHCVINTDEGVRSIDVPIRDYDRATIVKNPSTPYAYSPDLFRQRMLAIAEKKGISRRALALLDSQLNVDTLLPPDGPSVAKATVSNVSQRTESRSATPTRPNADSAGDNGSSGRHPSKPTAPNRDAKGAMRPPMAKPANGAVGKRVIPAAAPKPSNEAKRGALVHQLADELKLTPFETRCRLRKAGLQAPYTDLDTMRKAIV